MIGMKRMPHFKRDRTPSGMNSVPHHLRNTSMCAEWLSHRQKITSNCSDHFFRQAGLKACLAALLTLHTGCALFPGVPMGGSEVIHQLSPEEAARADSWAQSAWEEFTARNPHLAASPSFAQGFRDGYLNRLATNTRRQWQAGYRYGSWLALRQRLLGTTPNMKLEPTPLTCSTAVDGTGIDSVDGSCNAPHLAPFTAPGTEPEGGNLPSAQESSDLLPQPTYMLDGEVEIMEAPSTDELAPARKPEAKTTPKPESAEQPSAPQARPLPQTREPRPATTVPPPSNLPNPLDLNLPSKPEARPESEGSSPRPSPSNGSKPPIEDDLDLLSPFGNAVPPEAGPGEPAPSQPSSGDLDAPEEQTNEVNGFDLQIHDQFDGPTRAPATETRRRPTEDRRKSRHTAASYFERSVGPSGVRRTGHTTIAEDHLGEDAEQTQSSSFFGTAITSPITRGGSAASPLPAMIPLEKKVWYFDQE